MTPDPHALQPGEIVYLPPRDIKDHVEGRAYAGPNGRLWRCVADGDVVDFVEVTEREETE